MSDTNSDYNSNNNNTSSKVKKYKNKSKNTDNNRPASPSVENGELEEKHIEIQMNEITSSSNNSNSNSSSSIKSPAASPVPAAAPVPDYLNIVSIIGLQYVYHRELLYYIFSVLSFGLLFLLHFWFPAYFLKRRYKINHNYNHCDFLLITDINNTSEFCVIEPISRNSVTNIPVKWFKYNKPMDSIYLLEDKMFVFRHIRFIYSPANNTWNECEKYNCDTKANIKSTIMKGKSKQYIDEKLNIYGFNELNILVPSIPILLFREIFHPFFVFQLYSVILWFFEDYYIFAVCIALIATISIVSTLRETRERLFKISELAKDKNDIYLRVKRDKAWVNISSNSLIPGDIVDINSSISVFPCDLVLVNGSCVVNESMLTGESVPVVKNSVDLNGEDDQTVNIGNGDPRNTLFAATKILQLKPAIPTFAIDSNNSNNNNKISSSSASVDEISTVSSVLGVVVRTGFSTGKGSLILGILYPKPTTFKFVSQSYKFMLSLFCLSLVGFVISVWQLSKAGQSASRIVIRGLDLITIVVPPALPLCLTMGTAFSLKELKKFYLFCISPNKINQAGKIRLMCFDKTGTLTQEGMELMGIHPSKTPNNNNNKQQSFDKFVNQVVTLPSSPSDNNNNNVSIEIHNSSNSTHNQSSDFHRMPEGGEVDESDDPFPIAPSTASVSNPTTPTSTSRTARPSYMSTIAQLSMMSTPTINVNEELFNCLSSCHCLSIYNDELIGDPLEIEIFLGTKTKLQDTDLGKKHSKYTSVLFLPNKTDNIGILNTFEFQSSLQRMSVIAQVNNSREENESSSNNNTNNDDENFRVYCKGSPEMIGDLCIPSTLPSDYKETLTKYANSGYRVIALSYKPLRAADISSYASKERAEIRPIVERDLIFLGLAVLENKLKNETAPTLEILNNAAIRCVLVSGDHIRTAVTVAKECKLIDQDKKIFLSQFANYSNNQIEWVDTDDQKHTLDPVSLCPNNRSYSNRYELAVTGPVFKYLSESSLHSNRDLEYFHRVCLNSQVFARMSPDQKAELVSIYQRLGIYVGMCGDGANDSPALKQADAGVSLSDAEASIAAPFTYIYPNISCIPLLLTEGRSSLMSSFQLFKYMAMYSMVQFTAVILTYFRGSVLGNWQYLIQDLVIVFPLTMFIGSSKANRKLSLKRPSGNLLSLANISNVLIHMLICLCFQLIIYAQVNKQSDYYPYESQPGFATSATTQRTYYATSLYYFANFQFILMAVLFSLGRPWKQRIYKNKEFSLYTLLMCLMATLILFGNDTSFFIFSDEVSIQKSWRGTIFGFVFLNILVSCVFELFIFPAVLSRYKLFIKNRKGEMGFVYGKLKNIDGPKSKEYHRLRGQFEKNWPTKH